MKDVMGFDLLERLLYQHAKLVSSVKQLQDEGRFVPNKLQRELNELEAVLRPIHLLGKQATEITAVPNYT